MINEMKIAPPSDPQHYPRGPAARVAACGVAELDAGGPDQQLGVSGGMWEMQPAVHATMCDR